MLWVGLVLLLLVLAGVVAAVTVVEPWLRGRVVQEAADRIAVALDADVELHVEGRPLLLHAARRHLPGVVVVATDLPVAEGRAHLDRLRVELDDVRLVGRGEQRRAVAGAGRFHLDLDGDQLRALVTLPPYLVDVSIVPRGLRLQTLAGVVVDASVRLEPDAVRVRPRGSVLRLLPQPEFRVRLPAWPYGATIDGYTLHVGSVEAWGRLDPDQLVLDASGSWRPRSRTTA